MTIRAWFFSRPTFFLALLLLCIVPIQIVRDVRRAQGEIDLILDEGVVGLDRCEQMLQTLLDLRAGVLTTLIPASEADRHATAADLEARVDTLDRQNDRLAELELENLVHDDEGLALKALVDATEASVRQVIAQIATPGGDIAVSVRDATSVSAQIDACATELHGLSTRVAARARVADSEIPDALSNAQALAIGLGGISLLLGIVGLVKTARSPVTRRRLRVIAPDSPDSTGTIGAPRLRILHVLTHIDATRGGAIQALLLAREQQRAGHDVTIVANRFERGAPVHPTYQAWIDQGLRFHFFGIHDPQGVWCPPGDVLRFRKFLASGSFDVLHVHRDKALLFALAATVGHDVPAFISQRGTTHLFRHLVVGFAHRSPRVHRIIAVAEAVKAALVAQHVDPEKIDVVYGSFDVDRFDPARVDRSRVRRELGIADDVKLVATLGELNHRKDPDTFIRAFGLLAKRRSDVFFIHVGSTTDKAQKDYPALAAKKVGDRMKLLGWRSDVPEILAAADVLVNASAKNEGLTGTIREAFAMGRAVVCTATDGNPEIVIDGVTGLLVPPRDRVALAAAIESLLDDPALRHRLGDAGRRLVLEKMTMDRRAARMEEIYRSVLAEREVLA